MTVAQASVWKRVRRPEGTAAFYRRPGYASAMHSSIRTAAIAAVLLVAACSTSASPAPSGSPSTSPAASASGAAGPSVYPVIISSEQYVGSNRFVFSFVDLDNRPAASPDRPVSISAYPSSGGPSAAVMADATFMWSIPDALGAYRSTIAFGEPGPWTIEFATSAPSGPTEIIRFSLDVKAEASAVLIGDAAPAVKTPTLADVGGDIGRISSDTDPDAAFYEVSVDAALAAGEPFVLVFATPAFCTSSACGPMLETVKAVAMDHPTTRVINVEPYELTVADGQLTPVLGESGFPKPVPAVDAYGLLSEPWLFAVGADGLVTASFEGIVAEEELRSAFEALAAG